MIILSLNNLKALALTSPDYTRQINPTKYYALYADLETGDTWTIEFEVTAGGSKDIDIYVMTDNNFDLFAEFHDFFYYKTYYQKNTSGVFTYTVPSDDKYYIAFDNYFDNTYTKTVEINSDITYYTPGTGDLSDLEIFFIIFVIVLVIIIPVSIINARKRKKRGPLVQEKEVEKVIPIVEIPKVPEVPKEEVVKMDEDQKKKLYGMIKLRKEIDLEKASEFFNVPSKTIESLLYELAGEDRIQGKFDGNKFIIESDVNNFLDLLDDSFTKWDVDSQKKG